MENSYIGTMLSELAFTNFPIILKNTGFDFFIIDTEHGALDYSEVFRIVTVSKLAGIDSIIRLADNSRKDITKYTDMGATGILLPMTNTRADIEQVVKYAKYSPAGERGISTTRLHTMYNPSNIKDYMQRANHETKIYAQIETIAGVENSYDILATESVDGVFIGPNDLTCDLERNTGYGKNVLDCIKIIADNAKQTGKECGIITTNKDYIAFSKNNGVNNISYGSELNMIINSCEDISVSLKTLKERMI